MATKLDVSSLSKNENPSPAWHRTALEETSSLHEQGKVSFSDWNEAKVRLRGLLKHLPLMEVLAKDRAIERDL
jgi:hypothetical protein